MKIQIILFILLSLGLIACQPQRNREGVNLRNGEGVGPGSAGYGAPGSGINYNGQKPWGEITGPNLQAAAQNLVGNQVQVGVIGQTQNSGVFFQADVFSSNGGPILQALQQGGGAQIAAQSTLDIEIYDEYVGQQDPQQPGRTIPPIVIRMRPEFGSQASGTVSSQEVRIAFQDQYGQIKINGHLAGQMVQGTISFTAQGGEIALGQFNSHICALLRCN